MGRRITSATFIGRDEERAQLARLRAEAASGDPSHVLVGGEAGVGKSRLMADNAAAAESDGWLVLAGGCVDLGEGGLPFGPYVELLRGWFRRVGRAEALAFAGTSAADLGRLLPELRPQDLPTTAEQFAHARVHDALFELLTRLAATRPVLVVLEDLHWSGADTLAVTTSLLRAIRTERVLLCMTYRTDELHRRHPLRRWLAETGRSDRLVRIELPVFGRAEVAALVEGVVGSAPEALVDAVLRRSDGNAFFAEELLASGIQADEASLSASLRDLLAERIAGTSADAQRVLGIAAVAGRVVDDEILGAVAGDRVTDLHGSLHELIETGLLVPTMAMMVDGYTFRHALVQEVVYEDLLPGERRALHRAMALALEAEPGRGGGAGRLVELAHHWRASRDVVRAFSASARAGDESADAFAFAQAVAEYERVLEMWSEVPDPEVAAGMDRIELLRRTARALQLASEDRRAIALYEEAVDLSRAGPDRARTAVLLERLGRALWIGGDSESAVAAYEEAVSLVPGEPPTAERARVVAGLGQALMLNGEYPRSVELLHEAIAVGRATGAQEAVGHALNTMGTALTAMGDMIHGLPCLEEALDIARELRNGDDVGRAYLNLCDALFFGGDAQGVLERVPEGIAAAAALGVGTVYGFYISLEGVVAGFELGEWEVARDLLRAALARRPAGGSADRYRMAYSLPLLVGSGAPDARETWARAWHQVATVPAMTSSGVPPHLAGCDLALWDDDPEEAMRIADDGLTRVVESRGALFVLSIARLGARAAADLGAAAPDEATLGRARTAMTGYREVAAQGQAMFGEVTDRQRLRNTAEALALDAEGARLEGVATAATWAAVRDSWAAVPFPYQAAYASGRLALVAEAADHGAATAALRDAVATARRLGAVPMLAWLSGIARQLHVPIDSRARGDRPEAAPSRPFGLSVRELEVLELVAVGHTNRRIADDLFITESTAGVHVSNILSKLGVTSRTEAAALAIRSGIVGPADPIDP